MSEEARSALIQEVGEPMYNELVELRDRLRAYGWKNIHPLRERTNRSLAVIEAETERGQKHWFQVSKDGEFCPCVTFMGCK